MCGDLLELIDGKIEIEVGHVAGREMQLAKES
jgi:hypothetical protein